MISVYLRPARSGNQAKRDDNLSVLDRFRYIVNDSPQFAVGVKVNA